MGDILLSICISSYNRGERCRSIVQDILTMEDERYDIFICDDGSNEDTIGILRILEGTKVRIVEHKRNIGPCRNWYRTICCGDGMYILHVLDRDDISVNALGKVLDILESHPVGAGYIGKSEICVENQAKDVQKGAIVLKGGKEAFVTMAGVPVHPTGFLVSKEEWRTGRFRKFFYQSEKYGIYPHSIVLGNIAFRRDLLYMPLPFCSYAYVGNNKKSRFYEKRSNKDFWWESENMMQASNRMVLCLAKLADYAYKEEFACQRFQGGLRRVTFIYRQIVADKKEMDHYGQPVHRASKIELVRNALKYYISFAHILHKIRADSIKTKWKITRLLMDNLKDIVLEK